MLGLVDPKFITDIFLAVFAKDYAKVIEYTKALEDYEGEMVVDELIAYLKDKMYNQDALFSTLVLDRFFRILSDSKYLFSINADGSFVLSMIFFKMMEALRIKEIDQMIESFQNEVQRPKLVIPYADETLTDEVPVPLVEANIETINQTSSIEPEPNTPIIEEMIPDVPITKSNEKFTELIEKIKDRSPELAITFENSIDFISHEENILTWESCANEEAKKALTHGYSAIKQLVREVYGFNTKIKSIICTKAPTEKKTLDIAVPEVIPEKILQEPTAIIEEAEVGGSNSCVTKCSGEDNPSKEMDGEDILNDPIVQRATELFEATKRTVQLKI